MMHLIVRPCARLRGSGSSTTTARCASCSPTALRDAGYRVAAFDSARAALDALDDAARARRWCSPTCACPATTAWCFSTRSRPAHPHLPVIVMSAYTDIASTAGAFRGGAYEFLSKPFDLDEAVALARARAAARPTTSQRRPRRRRCHRGMRRRTDRRRARRCASCSAPSAGWRRRRCRCWSPARPAPARNWWRARCTANRRARASPSSR